MTWTKSLASRKPGRAKTEAQSVGKIGRTLMLYGPSMRKQDKQLKRKHTSIRRGKCPSALRTLNTSPLARILQETFISMNCVVIASEGKLSFHLYKLRGRSWR